MQEAHVSVEVIQFEIVFLNQLVFRLIEVLNLGRETEQICHVLHGLPIGSTWARCFWSNEVHLIGDAFLAERPSLIHVNDRLGEVFLAQTLLHKLVAIGDQHGRQLTHFGFFLRRSCVWQNGFRRWRH